MAGTGFEPPTLGRQRQKVAGTGFEPLTLSLVDRDLSN